MSWPLALAGSLRHLFSRAPIIWDNHIRISRSAIVKTRSQRKIYKENFGKKKKKRSIGISLQNSSGQIQAMSSFSRSFVFLSQLPIRPIAPRLTLEGPLAPLPSEPRNPASEAFPSRFFVCSAISSTFSILPWGIDI